METKQVIVIRKDLNMRKGKMCSQAAHASLGVILDLMKQTERTKRVQVEFGRDYNYTTREKILTFQENSVLDDWINGIFTKVTVGVDSEAELELLYYKAKDKSLAVKMIEDIGKTEFDGKLTKTCIAIGPGSVEDIDEITGHLKLL